MVASGEAGELVPLPMMRAEIETDLVTLADFSCAHATRSLNQGSQALARQRAAMGGRECSWEDHRTGEHLYACPERGILVSPHCAGCPFGLELSLRTPVVNADGEILADDERDYIQDALDAALRQAREALEDTHRFNRMLAHRGGKDGQDRDGQGEEQE